MTNIKEITNGLHIWIKIDELKGDTHLAVIDSLIGNNVKITSLTDFNSYFIPCKRLIYARICDKEEITVYINQQIKASKERIDTANKISEYIKHVHVNCGLIKRLLRINIRNAPTIRELDYMNEQLFMEVEKLKYYKSNLKDILNDESEI